MKETSIRSTVYAMMIAIVTLSSCAGEESETQQSPPVPITVTVNNSNSQQTRNDETTPYSGISVLQNTGFGLYCQPGSDSPIMSNQKFTYTTANGWTYSPTKYWPSGTDTKLNFIAYAPYTTTNKVSFSNSVLTYQYTVNTDSPFDNIDLCTAVANNQTSSGGAVELAFQHQTARLDVQVKMSDVAAGHKYFIKSVTINTHSLSPATLSVSGDAASWGANDGATAITYTLNTTGHFKEGIADPAFTSVDGFQSPDASSGLTTELQGIFPDSKILILLPVISTTTSELSITVQYVDYSVTEDANDSSVTELTTNIKSQTDTPSSFPVSSGHLYTLNIELNP